MRSTHTLGLACIAALSCPAAAAESGAAPPHPMTARAAPGHAVSTSWQPRAAAVRQDRLRYLNGSLCVERAGCTTSAAASQSPSVPQEFDYIDSLDLGTYGPMKFKFTGNRVKLKVRF